MQDYEQLTVWERAHSLAVKTYEVTNAFPSDEKYGLTSQLRRRAVSVPSNIAEGAGRSTRADFARFLSIAIGSASELHYQLRLSRDLGYIDEANHANLRTDIEDVKKMLTGLLTRLRSNSRLMTED